MSRNLPAELAGKAPRTGLYLPGVSGNYASCPRNPAWDFSGDLDIRWVGSVEKWVNGWQALVSHWQITTLKSWVVDVDAGGELSLYWSVTGGNGSEYVGKSTVPIPAADGETIGLRVVFDVDNGASGRTYTFYTSPDLGMTWVQLGAKVTQAGVANVYQNPSHGIEVGTQNSGTGNLCPSTVLWAEVRSGIDGPVAARFDARRPSPHRTRDDFGNNWSILGSAWAWELA